MPYRDPEYVQKKIELIQKGLPVDISEPELCELENHMRGASAFYVDMLQTLIEQKELGDDVDQAIADENKNIADIQIALREIDNFRKKHWSKIKVEED